MNHSIGTLTKSIPLTDFGRKKWFILHSTMRRAIPCPR